MAERKFWESDKLPPDYERVMAEKTLNYLKTERDRVQAELEQLTREGEGGHQRAQMHDSATLESHKNVLRGLLSLIGNLDGVLLIKSRSETDRIFLGNRIRLWLDVDDAEEIFTLLGPDDVATAHRIHDLAPHTTVISYKSSIGQAIVGRAADEWTVAQTKQALIGIRVVAIEPGDI